MNLMAADMARADYKGKLNAAETVIQLVEINHMTTRYIETIPKFQKISIG